MATQDTLQAMMIPGRQGSFTNSLPFTQNDTSSSSVSRDICRHKATSPQGCPYPPLKPTSNAPSQQPTNTQPTASMLASMGIKVRDFAYESTLPPLASVPRVPRQVQPCPRPMLKRIRRDHGETFVERSHSQVEPGPSNGEGSKKAKVLERTVTEPANEIDEYSTTTCERYFSAKMNYYLKR
jgi:hypothetical protein